MKRTAGDDLALPLSKKARAAAADPLYYFFKAKLAAPEQRMLSNFSDHGGITLQAKDVTAAMRVVCPEIDEWLHGAPYVFPTSEHCWQALSKAATFGTFKHFTTHGALLGCCMTTPWLWFRGVKTCEEGRKKLAYWEKRECIGIIAKMAVTRGETLGLSLRRVEGETTQGIAPATLIAIWDDILRLKFTQNVNARRALLATGDKILVELDIAANRKGGEGAEERCFWGGNVVNGVLRGHNFMGKRLMALRAALRAGEEKV